MDVTNPNRGKTQLKRTPQLVPMLKAVYDENLFNVLLEDREKVSLSITPAASYLKVT